jgi:2-keto-4-pentenoate hydratase
VDQEDVSRAADLLREAYASRRTIEPLTSTFTGMSVDDAYDVQLFWVAEQGRVGRKVRGHKVGLTSAAMQRQLGVDQPDFGHLLDDMLYEESQEVSMSRLFQPRIEPEVAFVLKKPLAGPGVTAAHVAQAVDYAVPSLEIIDSRVTDWRIALADTIADNASSAAVVLGATRWRLSDIDMVDAVVEVTRNGETVANGTTGAVMGNPLEAVAWLANALGARGQSLQPGHVVLPGSCTAAIAIGAGDSVTASFAKAGAVTAHIGP